MEYKAAKVFKYGSKAGHATPLYHIFKDVKFHRNVTLCGIKGRQVIPIPLASTEPGKVCCNCDSAYEGQTSRTLKQERDAVEGVTGVSVAYVSWDCPGCNYENYENEFSEEGDLVTCSNCRHPYRLSEIE